MWQWTSALPDRTTKTGNLVWKNFKLFIIRLKCTKDNKDNILFLKIIKKAINSHTDRKWKYCALMCWCPTSTEITFLKQPCDICLLVLFSGLFWHTMFWLHFYVFRYHFLLHRFTSLQFLGGCCEMVVRINQRWPEQTFIWAIFLICMSLWIKSSAKWLNVNVIKSA